MTLNLWLGAVDGTAAGDAHRAPGRCLRSARAGDGAEAAGIREVAGLITQHRAQDMAASGDLRKVPSGAGAQVCTIGQDFPREHPPIGVFERHELAGFGTSTGGERHAAGGLDGHAVQVQGLTGADRYMAVGGAGWALRTNADLVVGHRALVERDGAAELLLADWAQRISMHRLAVGRVGDGGQGERLAQATSDLQRAAGAVGEA